MRESTAFFGVSVQLKHLMWCIMNYTVPEVLHPKYRGCVWALKCLISFQLLYILWNQSWNVLIAQSVAALFADLSRKNKNKKISSRSVVSHLSRCWSVAKSWWQVFVLLAAFCSWTEMQLHMKTLLWRWILKWHSSHYVKSNITQCRGLHTGLIKSMLTATLPYWDPHTAWSQSGSCNSAHWPLSCSPWPSSTAHLWSPAKRFTTSSWHEKWKQRAKLIKKKKERYACCYDHNFRSET